MNDTLISTGTEGNTRNSDSEGSTEKLKSTYTQQKYDRYLKKFGEPAEAGLYTTMSNEQTRTILEEHRDLHENEIGWRYMGMGTSDNLLKALRVKVGAKPTIFARMITKTAAQKLKKNDDDQKKLYEQLDVLKEERKLLVKDNEEELAEVQRGLEKQLAAIKAAREDV